MKAPHRIRLLGPWQVSAIESLEPQVPLPRPARMTIPCSWRGGGWPGFRGRALHARHFGRPTGLDANERVRLVIEPLAATGTARLNGQPLGAISAGVTFEIDVTAQLTARNLLEIELAADEDSGGVTNEVRIEIHSSNEKKG